MRGPDRSISSGWLIVAAAILSGPPVSAADDVSGAVVARLCEHVKARKIMQVDRSQPEIIWSDGAMFEVATSFPPELEKMLAAPTATRDLRPVVLRMSDNKAPEWQDGEIVRSGRGEDFAVLESADGKLTLHVASPYIAYLRERYPKARIRMKGTLDPVLFIVDGTVRSAVMPLAMPRKSGQ